jgi:hypothetical protein
MANNRQMKSLKSWPPRISDVNMIVVSDPSSDDSTFDPFADRDNNDTDDKSDDATTLFTNGVLLTLQGVRPSIIFRSQVNGWKRDGHVNHYHGVGSYTIRK